MKLLSLLALLVLTAASPRLMAEDKPAKKLTCCEQAKADGGECKHKCCVNAHKDGKSCEKCNPGKEDLKLIKKEGKSGGK